MTSALVPSLARPSRRHLALGAVYFVAYLALNALTDHRSLSGSAVTLWSPDNALSVMLIMESWTFTPLVWVAQLGADILFDHARHPAAVTCAETTRTLGYLGLALSLRRGFGVKLDAMKPRDVVAVMALIPIGSAALAVLYCSALVAVGELPWSAFTQTICVYWIGDAAAMGVVIPATGALLSLSAKKPWRHRLKFDDLFFSTITAGFLGVVILLSVSNLADRYLFDLAFLPILLIGLKFGRDAGALALLLVQIMLLAALDWFHVRDTEYVTYQLLMFILAVSGLALGATVDEWQVTALELRRQQGELAKVSERATNGMIAAAMSHEISQPLAAIGTYVVSARRLLETGGQGERALGALRRAEGEAGRARAIIERLRDFVAKGEVARVPLDFADIVARVVAAQADGAHERGVALVYQSSGAAPALGDRVSLEQAVANLVLNAIEAAPQGEGHVRVTLERRPGWVAVKVEDDGPGVSPDMTERLFEPFETTKPRGMGLGLPLAREIALRHGGGLAFAPLSPRGACFRLEVARA